MLRRWRLTSGLLLFVFLLTHLLNHALGLAGLEALAAGRDAFLWLWRNPFAEALLLLALLLHLLLAGVSLYSRRNLLRLPSWQLAQLTLGLLIPPLLFLHLLGTTVAAQRFGTLDSYEYVLLVMRSASWGFLQQVLVLLVAWFHGALGLWFWLRLKPGFARWREPLRAALLLLPTLALAGTFAGLREVAVLIETPDWLQRTLARIAPPQGAALDWIYRLEAWLLWSYAALLMATMLARGLRIWREHRQGVVRIDYPGGVRVGVPRGLTILEASQLRRVPHAAVCGGRGRCSTCRVRVVRGADHLPAPSPAELKVLSRVRAGPDVRLACQTRPEGDISVELLLPAHATPRDAHPRAGYMQGQEREIAVLFADLRGFTSLAEQKLPYDVVFLLNRYFRGMAAAVERSGGRIDKFIGDGVMALFGLESDPATASRQALAAAQAMGVELAEMNRALAHDLPRPLKIGIGIHVGPAIVGEMGAGHAITVTAIGDTVNIASRLEALTKPFGAELVVSRHLLEVAGQALPGARTAEETIRGRSERLELAVLERLTDAAGATAPA